MDLLDGQVGTKPLSCLAAKKKSQCKKLALLYLIGQNYGLGETVRDVVDDVLDIFLAEFTALVFLYRLTQLVR